MLQALLCSHLLQIASFEAKPPQPLTAALAVRALTPEEAASKRPVKLLGVVTHATSSIGDCFVQDKTAGIYIAESALAGGLVAGDLVEVEGTSDPGTFAPMVVPTAIRKISRAPLPDPEPYDLRPQEARWLDGQYVQVYALAREISRRGPFTTLLIATASGAGEARIPGNHDEALRPLLGRTVRLRGVCVPKHDQRQTEGPIRIYVQSPANISAVPELDPPRTPLAISECVKGFSAVPHPSARYVLLSGTVTARINSKHFFLQDASGGVLAAATEPGEIEVGDQVVANGFLRIDGARLLLLQADLKKTGRGEPEQFVPIRLPTPLVDEHSFGRLARLEGVVDETAWRDGMFVINLHDGPARFQAAMEARSAPQELARIRAGTLLAITGVADLPTTSVAGEPSEPLLHLRSGGDVEVLSLPPSPSWWTGERVLWLALGFTGVAALGGLWVWLLHRQVRKQTALITQQFERESHLAQSLRQAQKLEAIGRLTAGIAHDFNNLLTVIVGASEMAAEHAAHAHDTVVLELIGTTLQAGRRAADLTRQLLTFSRQTPVKLEPLDLNAFVHEAEKLLGRVIGEHVHLATNCAEGLPPVRADAVLLHQVVLNLAANARDAMPRGGDLTIGTSLATNDRGDTVVRLTVSDTGCGMDEQTRSRLFEPFFTTKDVGKGTGLGLATVYGAIATLEGSIDVDSAVDRGTTIRIDLRPVQTAGAASPQESEPRRNVAAVILLVDDDEAIRKMCEIGMRRYGYTVLSAGSPVEALELARTHRGSIDLLVSDLIMPGMNGRDMAAIMRITLPRLHVLFMTGYPPDEVARIVGDLPDVEILAKPFGPMQLAAKVQDILEAESVPGRRRANGNASSRH